MQVPVFINCRDRLTSLLQLVAWLESAGLEEIYLIDNDSAYEPLLEYYRQTPHTVIELGENYGKLALWEAQGVVDRVAKRGGGGYVYSDPDVIPVEDCPLDALDRFAHLLEKYPAVNKVGFGLRIDDVPDHYRHRDAVIATQQKYWRRPVEPGAYYAKIDTTFALYRPESSQEKAAIRTGPPYVARHASWYLDFDNLSEEDRFYERRTATSARLSGSPHWSFRDLSHSFRRKVEKKKALNVATREDGSSG